MCINESKTLHGSVLGIVWCSFLCMSFSWMWWFCLSIEHCGRLGSVQWLLWERQPPSKQNLLPNGQGMCGRAFSSQILNWGYTQGSLVHIPVYEMKMSRLKWNGAYQFAGGYHWLFLLVLSLWVLAYIMTESSCCFQACSRNSKCSLVFTLAYTHCR
jgi:hypothetical protein